MSVIAFIFLLSNVQAEKFQNFTRQNTDYEPQKIHLLSESKLVADSLSGMVFIKGGSYLMGTDDKNYVDPYNPDNTPAHKVHLSSFYMSKYLVSTTQYVTYLNLIGQNKRAEALTDPLSDLGSEAYITFSFTNTPATDNWKRAKGYCQWLSKKTGLPFSLPTEAQWEYAARDEGKDIAYASVNGELELGVNYTDSKQATFKNNKKAGSFSLPVTGLPVNQLGIHQLGGNSSEWMSDWYGYDYYQHSPVDNPQGPSSGEYKSVRGLDIVMFGYGKDWKRNLSSYNRESGQLSSVINGFRCVINTDKPIIAEKEKYKKRLQAENKSWF